MDKATEGAVQPAQRPSWPENELLPEDFGGDTIVNMPVSAKEKTGINELLDMISGL